MQKSINLLPPEYQQRGRAAQHALPVARPEWLLLLLGIGAAIFYGVLVIQNSLLQDQLDRQTLTPPRDTVGSQLRLERVTRLEAVIREAVGIQPAVAIKLLASLTPQQVTWTSFAYDRDVLTIKGTSTSVSALGVWMETLTQQPQFAAVRLVRTAAHAPTGGGGVEFEIAVTVTSSTPGMVGQADR